MPSPLVDSAAAVATRAYVYEQRKPSGWEHNAWPAVATCIAIYGSPALERHTRAHWSHCAERPVRVTI